MMNNRFTSTADQQFGDTFIDVSQTERRLIISAVTKESLQRHMIPQELTSS